MDLDTAVASLSDIDNPDTEIEEDEIDTSDNPDDGEEVDDDTDETSEDEVEEDDEITEEKPEETEDPEEGDGDNAVVNLDGEEVSVGEIKKALQESSEYRENVRQIEENKAYFETNAKQVSENAERIDRIFHNFLGYVEKLIPPEPTMSLLQSDPQKYWIIRGKREEIMKELNGAFKDLPEVRNVKKEVNDQVYQANIKREENALFSKLPELKKPENFKVFAERVTKVAKEAGFTEEDLRNTTDHRVYLLLNLAAKGAGVSKIEKEAVKTVKNVIQPMRKITKKSNAVTTMSNSALQRLKRTGSIDDAVRYLMQN